MANNRREKMLVNFEKAIHNLDYVDAMKCVGALYYSNAEEAREKEAKLLFLMKDYKRCSDLFIHALPETQLENELYVCSLALLGKEKEVNIFLEGESKIGISCSVYMQRYMQSQGMNLNRDYCVREQMDEFFEKLLLKDIVIELVSVYEELEDAKIMRDSGIDTSNIIEQSIRKIKSIPIRNDVYLDDIYKQVQGKGFFESDLLIAFVYIHIGRVNSNVSMVRVFKEFDDIIFYLDVLQRIDPKKAILDTMCEYLRPILEEAQRGNKIIGDYLRELYVVSEQYSELKINETDTVAEIWKKELGKNYPSSLAWAEEAISNNKIKELLSSQGKVAYDAAVWQYKVTIEDGYGIRDAGMLCLAYMRIIELELNNSIVAALKRDRKNLLNIFNNTLNELNSKDKRAFNYKWKICIEGFNGENGFTLEKLWHLFENLSVRHSEDAISIRCMEVLEKELLGDEGVEAMRAGTYADIIDWNIREKFRNPPAHTRYVGITTALECREYVENKIKKLHSYKRSE